MSKKTKRLRRCFHVFRLCSVIVAICPLLVFFLMNFGRYVRSAGDIVKLSLGGLTVLVIATFVALGKFKVPGRLVTAFALCLICWLLSAILADLTVITTIWLVSTAVDVMIFVPLVKHTQKRLDMSETADTTAAVTMDAVKNYLGRV